MKNFGKVQSTVKPGETEYDAYSVWVNENITEITVPDEEAEHTEYEYTQKQYAKDEYISLLDERNKALAQQLTNTQLALCDVYEMIGE